MIRLLMLVISPLFTEMELGTWVLFLPFQLIRIILLRLSRLGLIFINLAN